MIEIRAKDGLRPLGMPAARFLRGYWQKKPLLIRGAFPTWSDPLTPDDLAGLACEPGALSRIVVHDRARDRWRLRTGPFQPGDFARMPGRDWTLLVQDVDKWDADVAALLAPFDFLPAWRIDDIMVSYAVDGGSVGAHVDQYDVFLLQGRGRRRWRISTDPAAAKDFRDDAEIRLLRRFEPTHEWTLEPGDMLYLPPGIPHHGEALGECLTFSIGMRAPSSAELLVDFAETLAGGLPEELRLGDPDLTSASGDGEIDDAAIARVARAMPWLRLGGAGKQKVRRSRRGREPVTGPAEVDASLLRTWFGRFITRYRSTHEAAARARPISEATLARAFGRHALALRNPWSRAAWTRARDGAILFVAGTEHACSVAFARLVSSCAPIALDRVANARDRDALRRLIDLGHVTLCPPARRHR
jgi:50S ribosomal protein L16 3-hydroxylase